MAFNYFRKDDVFFSVSLIRDFFLFHFISFRFRIFNAEHKILYYFGSFVFLCAFFIHPLALLYYAARCIYALTFHTHTHIECIMFTFGIPFCKYWHLIRKQLQFCFGFRKKYSRIIIIKQIRHFQF